jgi:hypothetical protein
LDSRISLDDYDSGLDQKGMDFGNGFTRMQSFYDENLIRGHDYDNDQFYEPRLTSDE